MPLQVPPGSVSPKPAPGAEATSAAALAICESLLLALNDRHILPEREIVGLLQDAAAAHANDPGDDGRRQFHLDVAQVINKIIDGGSSVRRE